MTVLSKLSARSTLALDDSQRKVVLKELPPDCLIDGELRDGIRERLQRIRELPLAGVANLIRIEFVNATPVLMWEYMEGVNLETSLQQRDLSAQKALAQELTRHIHALHALGLVHGAIKSGNIIVTDHGIKLTDFSPLLFTDPSDDLIALRNLVQQEVPDTSPVLEDDPRSTGIRLRAIFGAVFTAIAGVLLFLLIRKYAAQWGAL